MPAPPPTPSPCSSGWRAKLEQYPGQLTRAAVELAKDWRTDRYLRRLEAMMIVADADVSLVLTGTGDVLEPKPASWASAPAAITRSPRRARCSTDRSTPRRSSASALDIAADICVFTNRNVTVETLEVVSDTFGIRH